MSTLETRVVKLEAQVIPNDANRGVKLLLPGGISISVFSTRGPTVAVYKGEAPPDWIAQVVREHFPDCVPAVVLPSNRRDEPIAD